MSEGIWYWGDTDTGKSRRSRDECDWNYVIYNFGGFQDEFEEGAALIFEDIDPSSNQNALQVLKNYCDGYPVRWEVKYKAPRRVHFKRVFVTSNHPPSSFFLGKDLDAIEKRYRVVRLSHHTGMEEEPVVTS